MLKCYILLFLLSILRELDGNQFDNVLFSTNPLEKRSLHNRFICDCSLLPISKWLNLIRGGEEILCSEPTRLRGVPVVKLPEFIGDCKQQHNVQKRVRRAANSDAKTAPGIHATYTGDITNPKIEISYVNDTSQKVEYELKSQSIRVKQNSLQMNTEETFFLIPVNTAVSIQVQSTTTPCSGFYAVKQNMTGFTGDPLECSQMICLTGTYVNSSCNSVIKWNLNVIDNIKIVINVVMDGSKMFSAAVFVKVVNTDHMIVNYSPSKPKPECPLMYEINTNMTLQITYSGNLLTPNRLYVNGSFIKESTTDILWYVFDVAGTCNVSISKSTAADALWKQSVIVKVKSFEIDLKPKFQHANVCTDTNITFFLKKKIECVTTNPIYNWSLDGTIYRKENLIYKFPLVGALSKTFKVEIENFPIDEKHVIVYDKIKNFTVVLKSPQVLCKNTPIRITTGTSSGSAVQYFYQVLPDQGLIRIQTGDEELNLTENVKKITIRFWANNVVSKKHMEKEFTFLDNDVKLVLLEWYVVSNIPVQIQPSQFSICKTYFYRWNVSGVLLTRWQHGEVYDIPQFLHNFTKEGVYNTSLEIQYNSSSVLTKSNFIHVKNAISVDLPYHDNAHVGRYILKPLPKVTSNSFRYRWIVSGFSPFPWVAGNTSNQPHLELTFQEENLYNVTLEVNDNLSNDQKTMQVLVQYSVRNVSLPSVIYAETNKSFYVNITYSERSRYQYKVNFTDGIVSKIITNSPNIASFTYLHVYTTPGNFTLVFTFMDNLETFTTNVSVIVMNPITGLDASLSPTLVSKCQLIRGHINNAGVEYPLPTYHWYRVSPDGLVFINTGIVMKSIRFNFSGKYDIVVRAQNEVSNFTYTMSVEVKDNGTLPILLTAEPNLSKVHPEVIVTPGSMVQFDVKLDPSVDQNLTVNYQWYFNGNLASRVQTNVFNHNFTSQGEYKIRVNATTRCESGSSELSIFVQSVLTQVSLTVEYDRKEIQNNSVISEKADEILVSHVYFEPTDATGVSGQLHCYTGETNEPKETKMFVMYNPDEIFNVPIKKKNVTGRMSCFIGLKNRVSKTDAVYFYFVGSAPILNIINTPSFGAVNQSIQIQIEILNHKLTGNLHWFLNDTEIVSCVKTVEKNLIQAECVFFFSNVGLYTIYVILRNNYYEVPLYHNISILNAIKTVSISPLIILEGQSINITANVSGKYLGNLNYNWEQNKSLKSYITFGKDKIAGAYNITVNISNAVSSFYLSKRVIVYRNLTKDNLYIKNYFTYIQRGNRLVFQSSIVDSFVQYKWFLNNISISSHVETRIRFNNLGKQQVKLTLSTPYQQNTAVAYVFVMDPVTNIVITPLHFHVKPSVNISATASGGGPFSYFWPEFNSNKSYIVYSAVTAGLQNISVLISNPISSATAYETLKIYDLQSFGIKASVKIWRVDSNRIIYIPFNTTINFSVANADPNSDYSWNVQYNKTISPTKSGETYTYHFGSQGGENLVLLQAAFGLERRTKDVIVRVGDHTTMFQLSLTNKYLLTNRTYQLIIKWNNQPVATNAVIQVSGTNSSNKSIELARGQAEIWFHTPLDKKLVTVSINVCTHLSCREKSWNFTSLPKVNEILPTGIIEHVEIDKSLNLTIGNHIPEANVTWYLIDVFGNRSILGSGVYFEFSFKSYTFPPGQYVIEVTAVSEFIGNPDHKLVKQFNFTLYSDKCEELNITENLKNQILLNDASYKFNISWKKDCFITNQTVVVNNVKSFTHTTGVFKGYSQVSITTLHKTSNISISITLCKHKQCVSKNWTHISVEKRFIEDIVRENVDEAVEVNGTWRGSIQNDFPDSNISWYLHVNDRKILIAEGTRSIAFDISLYVKSAGDYIIEVVLVSQFIDKSINHTLTKRFTVTVFFEDCEKPSVVIDSNDRTHTKSKWFYSEINFITICPNVTSTWSFTVKDGKSCETKYTAHTFPGFKLTMDKPSLEVPPRAFKVGSYCVQNLLRYGKSGRVSERFFLEVVSTPLVPVIGGGSYRVIGNQQDIVLDATKTIDPDLLNGRSNLLYKWVLKSNACFTNLKNGTISEWSVANAKLSIKQQCLSPKHFHNFTLYVKRVPDKEFVVGVQQVYVIEGVAPVVEIECITCKTYKTYKYIASKKIKMSASCLNCGEIEGSYSWKVIDQERRPVALTSENVLSPLDTSVLVLDKNVLDGKQNYTFICDVRVKGMHSMGTTQILLLNNPSPINGQCTISPHIGISMVDNFTVSCQGWHDADNVDPTTKIQNQPFIYWLLAGKTNKPSDMSIIYRGIKRNHTTHLQLGNEKDGGKLFIQIIVEDSLGAQTVAFNDSVIVTTPDVAKRDPVRFVTESIMPGLTEQVTLKDVNLVTLAIIACSNFMSKKAGNENRSRILNELVMDAAKIDASSVESITQIVNALTSIVKVGGVNEVDSQSRDLTSKSLKRLLDMSGSFSMEGFSLEDYTYSGFMELLISNLEYYRTGNSDVRMRRSVGGARTFNSDYKSLQQLYEVILHATVAGESSRMISSGAISALLLRKKGKRVAGTTYAGSCKVTTDVSKIHNMNDVSGVFECSNIDPYEEFGSYVPNGTVSSLKFLSSNMSEISLTNLAKEERIKFTIPYSFNLYHKNSTIQLNKDELYLSVLPKHDTFIDLPAIGINIVVDILTEDFSGNIFVHFSKNQNLTFENKATRKLTVDVQSDENLRTIFLSGREYGEDSTYFYGLEHDSSGSVNLTITTYISHCNFWNATKQLWESVGCTPAANTTRQHVVCSCNHLTSFTSSIELAPNPLDFTVLKKLDVASNPIAVATCGVIVAVYLIVLFLAYRKDKKEQTAEHFIPYIGSDEGFYQYEIRLKTGVYPWAGSTARVGIQIFGTSCTTKVRVIKTENSFQRNAVDIFRISVDRSIGKIHKIRIWHDNTGASPSWYLERVVIRSLVNGEKFFFFCNKWIGTDCEDGSLEHEFLVADIHEMQKFSTIFFDMIGRGFNDYHLWMSVFERPRFSKFNRVQRVTCLVTFVLSWMCVNAMWFQVAPDGQVDVYIGFKGYSFNEILIGMISAMIVFPLNFILITLFRKSRQTKIPPKPLKIYKPTKHIKMQVVDLDTVPLFEERDDSANTFDIGEVSSPLQRKQKYFNIHDAMTIENSNTENQPQIDNLVLRTSMLNDISIDSPTSLTLPHAFEDYLRKRGETFMSTPSNMDSSSLTMSPQHQYRTSSARLSRKKVGYEPLGLSLKRTLSCESLQLLPTKDEETRLMTPRLNPDELRSHMTDIVEHQLSSMFHEFQESSEKSNKQELGLPSDYSSGIYHHEAITSALVKKNEMLAERLEIPAICELDPCTRWTLPSWCSYVAYLLCFVVSGMSMVIVVTFGQQFGYEISLKWLRALFVGFLEDALLAYPFVLIFTSAVVALFIKPLDLDKVDHYDFVECPSKKTEMMDINETSPPSGFALELAQCEGARRKHLRTFAKDFVLQMLLMWFVIAICTIKFSYTLYPSTNQLERNLNQPMAFSKISSVSNYWSWFETTWLSNLYDPSKESYDSWQLASRPVIRQVRAATGDCISEEHASMLNVSICSKDYYTTAKSFSYNWSNEVTKPYTASVVKSPWVFQKYPYISSKTYGWLSDYPSGGYELLLPLYNLTDALSQARLTVQNVKKQQWFDKYTRALIHNYVMLNGDTLQYSFVELLIEMTSSGFITTSFNVRYLPVYYFMRSVDYFCISCVFFLLALVVYLLCHAVSKAHVKGFKELRTWWDFHTMLMIITAGVGIIMQLGEVFLLEDFRNRLNNGYVPDGFSIHHMALYHDVGMFVFGFLGFLVIMRNVRLFSLSNIYHYCSEVLQKSSKPLLHFTFMHVLFVVGFSISMLITFQSSIFEYRTFWTCFLSTLFNRWWKPGARKMIDASYGLGIFWSVLWMVYWLVIATNMYKAIILNSDTVKKSPSLNIWSLFWKKIKRKRKKQQRRVRFENVETPDDGGEQIVETVIDEETAPQHDDLPPFPVPLFDLNSNLMTILAGLDQMVVHEEWEVHVLSELDRKLRVAKSKVKIEKLNKY